MHSIQFVVEPSALFGVLLLIAVLLLLGSLESLVHRRRLASIPIRVHVNGTRGKSSVVRLIAAGLRAGGLVTCAKTTGSAASMILPDGSEFPLHRPAQPNIIEQVRVVETASECGAEALVVECMALQPLLQSLSELRLIRATLGVITNVRADHLDVMGPTETDVALALAGTIPRRAKLLTTPGRHLETLAKAAADRDSQILTLSTTEIDDVEDDELRQFKYLEHKENVALALRVCAELGIDRGTALRGMWDTEPDPGALTVHDIDFFGRRIVFANALAANDPESTEKIWRAMTDLAPTGAKRIALFNCRIDRPDRSRQLGEACVDWATADHYVLTGTGTYILARAAIARGLDVRKLVIAEHSSAPEAFEILLERAGSLALIVGMGNIHGSGGELARLFRNRGVQRDTSQWN